MKKKFAWIIAALMVLIFPVAAFAETEPPEPSQESAIQNQAEGQTEEVPQENGAQQEQPADPEASPTPEPTPTPTATPPETSETKEGSPEVDLSQITSLSAMLIDADTGEVLFSKNADWTIFPASTTKLMTAVLVAENCKPEDMVTFTVDMKTEVNKSGGSMMGLKNLPVDSQISVKDLFYGLMLCSGNDAAIALGMHIAGTEQAFVDMMNRKAQELGMTGTHFINPHGLYIHNVGYDHYSTAADMAKLAVEAKKYPMITEAETTQTYTYESVSDYCQVANLPPDTIENSNYLIHTPVSKPELAAYLYDKATGMKTGTLENILPPGATEYIKSYGCLVASASNGGLNLIAVIFGDLSVGDKEAGIPNAYARWDIAKYLFDYGFANYAKIDLAQFAAPVAFTEQIENFAANDPEKGSLEVEADLAGVESDTQLLDAATAQGLQDGSIKLEEQTNIDTPLQAPITQGQQIGTVTYSLQGKELYTVPLIAGRDIYAKGEESETSEEYGVPVFTFEAWYLWVIVPAAVVLTLITIRAVNKSRRRAGYAKRTAAVNTRPAQARTGGNVRRRNVDARNVRPAGGRKHKL